MGMEKELFQITEAARACGLSRSTLLRMEEKGLLTPAYITPDSGRRYYDNHNVARIMQIEKFKSMGISNEQIINYFVRGGEAADILATLAERLHDFQRSVEELRLRVREKAGMSVQVITLPAVTCIMRRYWGHTSQEKYDAMYALYHECIRKGYILSDDPLFTISDRKDFLEGYIGKDPFPFDVCVPLRADKAPCGVTGVPGALGTLLRRIRRHGRGVADPGQRGKGSGSEAQCPSPCTGHCSSLHRPGDQCPTLLLPPCLAGGGGIKSYNNAAADRTNLGLRLISFTCQRQGW